MNREMVMGLVRHLAGFAGAWLAAQGVGGESFVELFSGAALAAAAVAWSILDKKFGWTATDKPVG